MGLGNPDSDAEFKGRTLHKRKVLTPINLSPHPSRKSETIMRTELDLPRRRTDIGYLSKITVGYVVVGISIARDVEHVEEICTESDCLSLGHVEFLECREIHLPEAGRALPPNGRRAER